MKYVKLSCLGELKNGMNYDKDAVKNGVKIISVADFGKRTFPEFDSLGEIDSSIVGENNLLQNGDIVFVRSNGNKNLVGRSMLIDAIGERKVCYSGFCISLRPNSQVYAPYLFYALRSPFCRKQYSYSPQTNITNLSQDVLKDVTVPICDFDEQVRIGNVLLAIDRKISNNDERIRFLQDLSRTIFDYWFVQFEFPNDEGKPYKNSNGNMCWNDEIKRNIPEGWKVDNLYEIADYHNGLACQKHRPNG